MKASIRDDAGDPGHRDAPGARRSRLCVRLDPALHARVGLWARWSGVDLSRLVSVFLEEQVAGFEVRQGPGPRSKGG